MLMMQREAGGSRESKQSDGEEEGRPAKEELASDERTSPDFRIRHARVRRMPALDTNITNLNAHGSLEKSKSQQESVQQSPMRFAT